MRWSIAFVTMDRPLAAQRFVRSARRLFPDVPIFVADQSAELEPMQAFYEAERITLVRTPVDAGLSASRNALVAAMDVDYFALCDDDFVLGPLSSFTTAIDVLAADEALGVVGGMLHDLDRDGERIRNWEVFFDHDERHGRFTVTPIYTYPPLVREVAGRRLYTCDAVLNFAVYRRALFEDGLRWDDRIKINGEHEDFFLALKTHGRHGVAYLPSMAALHLPAQNRGRYAARRARAEGRQTFMRKWGVSSHVEIGPGGRPLDGTPVETWFAADATRDDAQARPATAMAQLRLYTTLTPLTYDRQAEQPEYHSFRNWVAGSAQPLRPLVPGQLRFRYQPDVDPDGDVVLWCRGTHDTRDRRAEEEQAGLVLRWFSPGGDVLVWESDVHTVRAAERRYWQPIPARIPLRPRGAPFLRFEVVCASSSRVPLAMGFVFPTGGSATRLDHAQGSGVLAWTRTEPAAAGLALPPGPLEALLAGAPRVALPAVPHDAQGWVALDASTLTVVGMVSRQAGWASVCVAAGARESTEGPVHLALPRALVDDPGTTLFAHMAGAAAGPLLVAEPVRA